ncbi:MAG: hypothetical protein ACRDPM_18305, partial [Solirubrobacteraceae bacterium]
MTVRTRDIALVGSSETALRSAADGILELGTPGGRITTHTRAEVDPEALAHHLVIWIDADDGASVPWAVVDLVIP